MQKATVYFIPLPKAHTTHDVSTAAKTLLATLQEREHLLDFTQKVPLKVHFGEEHNTTFITPANFAGIIEYLKEHGAQAVYTETNVLYKGKRTTRESHTKLALEHGFTQLPIEIADGDMGEAATDVTIAEVGKHFTTCALGTTIAQSPQLIVLAHVKGHGIAGFGGALKQLSMGCAARSGKLAMHAHAHPLLNPLQCKRCHTCAENCPADACIIDTPIPHINTKTCIGCAKCIAMCPHNAIHVNWLSTGQNEFVEKLAEYAYAAQKNKKVAYLNFVLTITPECDCMGNKQKIIAQDIGVLASSDPIALDTACLDVLRSQEKKKLFGGEHILEYAEKLGFGTRNYTLVTLK